jgi:putative mRNA 3-end processing factor
MKLIEDTDQIFVHSAIHNLNKAISDSGIELPESQLLDANFNKKDIENKIVILPPPLLGSKMLKRIPNAATAICSGWMQIRGNRRWRGVDAGFVVSDHADWNGLISAVKATEAEKVYVTHGSQASFSKYLNEIGIEAAEVKTEYGDNELESKEESLKSETV